MEGNLATNKKNLVHTAFDLAATIPGISPTQTSMQRCICMGIHFHTLCNMDKMGNNVNAHQWHLVKLCYIHTMEYYTANKIMKQIFIYIGMERYTVTLKKKVGNCRTRIE